METVAGITAMQDLASRAGISLAEGTEPVTLVPLNGGVGALDQALACGGTVVGYKVGAAASPAPAILRDRLHAAGRLDGAVIGARLGLEGELIAPAAEILAPPRPPPRPPPAAEAPARPAEAPAPPRPSPRPACQAPAHRRAPASPVGSTKDIPDIPYLSTLIAPPSAPPPPGHALRSGGARRPVQTATMVHRCRSGRHRWYIEPATNRRADRGTGASGAGVLRGSRSRGAGPADLARGAGHSRRRRGDLGVEPGAPATCWRTPKKRRDRGLGQAPDGGRAALLRARGAAETNGRPRPLRRPLAVGRHRTNSSSSARPSAWTPRSCPGCPASPRWRRGSGAS